MKELGSLAQLAEVLVADTVHGLKQVKHGLEHAVVLIEKTAREEFGTYQQEIAMFPTWAQLSPATEANKARLGYPENAPLEASGELRDSSQHEVGDFEAVTGSTDPKMEFHELGTSRMPARPVWGPALYRNIGKIQKLIGDAAVAGYVGSSLLGPEAGYTIDEKSES